MHVRTCLPHRPSVHASRPRPSAYPAPDHLLHRHGRPGEFSLAVFAGCRDDVGRGLDELDEDALAAVRALLGCLARGKWRR
jgi:hypothetical protein